MNPYEQWVRDWQSYQLRREAALKLPLRKRFFALFDIMAELIVRDRVDTKHF